MVVLGIDAILKGSLHNRGSVVSKHTGHDADDDDLWQRDRLDDLLLGDQHFVDIVEGTCGEGSEEIVFFHPKFKLQS